MFNKPTYIPHNSSEPAQPSPEVNDDSQNNMPTAVDIPRAVNVPVGAALPSGAAHQLPTLNIPVSVDPSTSDDLDKQSMIAEGVNFVGNAQLRGVCSVGGRVEGNLIQSDGHRITVIVAETGHVLGDILASTISVMGQTEGLLDATGGNVTLHDTSRVSGHVRYNRLQVNGADLNATLEKAVGPLPHPTGLLPALHSPVR